MENKLMRIDDEFVIVPIRRVCLTVHTTTAKLLLKGDFS